jgi:hypothetical protein
MTLRCSLDKVHRQFHLGLFCLSWVARFVGPGTPGASDPDLEIAVGVASQNCLLSMELYGSLGRKKMQLSEKNLTVHSNRFVDLSVYVRRIFIPTMPSLVFLSSWQSFLLQLLSVYG